MDILVTGGNGLLGRHLVTALQRRGERVRVLALPHEDARWLAERGVAVYPGDIRSPETLAPPMRGVWAVVHLAGLAGVRQTPAAYHDVNVTGTENVCRAALAAGVGRVVHVSSWLVYGMALGRPAREDFLLRPLHEPLSITKAAGDRAVQRMIADDHLPAVILRPGAFFGPGDVLCFGRIADRLLTGQAVIVGPGDNALPLVYVTDVVDGLLLALDHRHAVGQAYNLASDQPLTQEQFLAAAASDIGALPPRVHIPYRALYVTALFAERLASATGTQPAVTQLGVRVFGTDNRLVIDKARRELGYRPRIPLREGLRLTAAWYLTRRQSAASPASSAPPA